MKKTRIASFHPPFSIIEFTPGEIGEHLTMFKVSSHLPPCRFLTYTAPCRPCS